MNNHHNEGKQQRRKPPPAAYRYLPGRSGNLRGRRKGSISLKALTRKVARKRHSVPIDGRKQSLTRLELVIVTLRNMAVTGHTGAKKTLAWLNERRRSDGDESRCGFLLAPETLSEKEAMAQLAAYAADHPYEPGSPEWYRWKEERPSAPPPIDPASPLGIALREFKQKWGCSAPEPSDG